MIKFYAASILTVYSFYHSFIAEFNLLCNLICVFQGSIAVTKCLSKELERKEDILIHSTVSGVKFFHYYRENILIFMVMGWGRRKDSETEMGVIFSCSTHP